MLKGSRDTTAHLTKSSSSARNNYDALRSPLCEMMPGMRLSSLFSAVLLTLSLGAVAAACSDAELGEKCEDLGKTDECEDGLVCGKETGGAIICMQTCSDNAQCPADRECNGIEGTSTKACRLKTK